MEYFRQLVTSSIRYHASHLYCIPGQPPAIKRFDRLEFLQIRKSSTKEIEDIVAHLLNADTKAELEASGSIRIEVEFDAKYHLRVYIVKSTLRITVLINKRPLPKEHDIPRALIQAAMHLRGRALFLGGEPHHNKNITVALLLNQIATYQKKHILAFGLDDELIQETDNSIISPCDTSLATPKFIQDQAADIVVFNRLERNLVNTLHDCIMLGISVIATVDAVSMACMMEKIIFLFPDRKTGIRFLSTHALGMALQVFIARRTSEEDDIYVYDFVECDEKIKGIIESDDIDQIDSSGMVAQINKLIEKNLLTHYDAQHVFANLTKSHIYEGSDLF